MNMRLNWEKSCPASRDLPASNFRGQATPDDPPVKRENHAVRAAGDGGRVHPPPPRPSHRPRPYLSHREQVQNKRLQHQIPLQEEQRWNRGQDR